MPVCHFHNGDTVTYCGVNHMVPFAILINKGYKYKSDLKSLSLIEDDDSYWQTKSEIKMGDKLLEISGKEISNGGDVSVVKYTSEKSILRLCRAHCYPLERKEDSMCLGTFVSNITGLSILTQNKTRVYAITPSHEIRKALLESHAFRELSGPYLLRKSVDEEEARTVIRSTEGMLRSMTAMSGF